MVGFVIGFLLCYSISTTILVAGCFIRDRDESRKLDEQIKQYKENVGDKHGYLRKDSDVDLCKRL